MPMRVRSVRRRRRIGRSADHRPGVVIAPPASSAGVAAATAAARATPTDGEAQAAARWCGVLLVENIEGRQAHIGNFFIGHDDLMVGQRLVRRSGRRYVAGCGRGTARQRQRQTGGTQNRGGLTPAPPRRSSFGVPLVVPHGRSPMLQRRQRIYTGTVQVVPRSLRQNAAKPWCKCATPRRSPRCASLSAERAISARLGTRERRDV
jgi:hypothetical protein